MSAPPPQFCWVRITRAISCFFPVCYSSRVQQCNQKIGYKSGCTQTIVTAAFSATLAVTHVAVGCPHVLPVSSHKPAVGVDCIKERSSRLSYINQPYRGTEQYNAIMGEGIRWDGPEAMRHQGLYKFSIAQRKSVGNLYNFISGRKLFFFLKGKVLEKLTEHSRKTRC